MFVGVAIHKVWRDLWRNKGRTALVVLSIAIGVMAVGMILSSNRLISRQVGLARAADGLAHGFLVLSETVDADTFGALERVPHELHYPPVGYLARCGQPLGRSRPRCALWRAPGRRNDFPFVYRYPVDAAITWLGIIVVLSILASWLPARRASQISVRESLAYE